MDQVHARTLQAPPSASPARPAPEQQPPRARADALARATPTGRFRVDVASGTWWWSDETFRIYGFEPDEVVPTRGLVLTHKHPEDRTRAQAAIAHAERSETPFSCLHPIFDADGEEHLVVVVGRGHRGTAGRIATITGYVGDLTEPVDRYAAVLADGQIFEAAQSRGAIERAKGVLCAVHDVGEDDAFTFLRRASMRSNVPVRVLAGRLVDFARHEARAGRPLAADVGDAFLSRPDAPGDGVPVR